MTVSPEKTRGSGRLGIWAAALLLGVAGCSPRSPRPVAAQPAGRFPIALGDDSRRVVAIQALPRRIVSLSPGHTETLFDLGVGERVVATDKYSTTPAAARTLRKLDCWPRPPVEAIVALRPDLVLCLAEGDDFLRQMDDLGIPTLKFFPTSIAGALSAVRLVGKATGVPEKGEALAGEIETRLEALRSAQAGSQRPKVLLEMDGVDPLRPYVAGSGGLYGEILALAGGDNVFADVREPVQQVSAEQVITRNPEVILLGDSHSPVSPQTPERVRTRPGWATVSAVKTGRVFTVDADRLTRPCRRLADAAEELARLLRQQDPAGETNP